MAILLHSATYTAAIPCTARVADASVELTVFSALQVYVVASSFDVFDTTSVLVWFLVPTGIVTMEYFEDAVIMSDSPLSTLSQVISGRGRPLAEQVNVAMFGCTIIWS